jgi:hypothetical protein
MRHRVTIKTPFPSFLETASILGVSPSEAERVQRMLSRRSQTAPKEIRRFSQTGIGRAIACANPSRSLCLDNARSREKTARFFITKPVVLLRQVGPFSFCAAPVDATGAQKPGAHINGEPRWFFQSAF